MEDVRIENYESNELEQLYASTTATSKSKWLALAGVVSFLFTFFLATYIFDLNPLPVKLIEYAQSQAGGAKF